jgi:hypothetical protein
MYDDLLAHLLPPYYAGLDLHTHSYRADKPRDPLGRLPQGRERNFR